MKSPKPKLPKQPSKLERDFMLRWSTIQNAPTMIKEHRPVPDRKWRFDFCNLAGRVAIELEGGVYTGGRHTRGKGFENDCEKYNEAILSGGWFVFRLTGGMMEGKNGGWELLNRIAKFTMSRIGTI